MHTSYFWDSFHIYGRKIVVLFVLSLFVVTQTQAQKSDIPNMIDHDSKAYYFGLSFTFNTSSFRILKSDYFTAYDSVLSMNPLRRPGMGVGILGSLKLTNRFDLRFVPSIHLADRSIVYVDKYGPNAYKEQYFKSESILFHLPLSLKLKSDRIKNFRFYALAGFKFDWDMNSNANSRKINNVIKVKNTDFGYELGGGLEFFRSNFILSPEVKLSRGLNNLNIPEDNSQISNSIMDLRSYIWMFSLNLKG